MGNEGDKGITDEAWKGRLSGELESLEGKIEICRKVMETHNIGEAVKVTLGRPVRNAPLLTVNLNDIDDRGGSRFALLFKDEKMEELADRNDTVGFVADYDAAEIVWQMENSEDGRFYQAQITLDDGFSNDEIICKTDDPEVVRGLIVERLSLLQRKREIEREMGILRAGKRVKIMSTRPFRTTSALEVGKRKLMVYAGEVGEDGADMNATVGYLEANEAVTLLESRDMGTISIYD